MTRFQLLVSIEPVADIKRFWDHSASPSQWVIKREDVELFRGTYDDGVMYLLSLENAGMIAQTLPKRLRFRKRFKETNN